MLEMLAADPLVLPFSPAFPFPHKTVDFFPLFGYNRGSLDRRMKI
jgi:hypothetical protein